MSSKYNNIIDSCTDILRTDDGISGAVHYTEVLSWILFLKFLEDKENDSYFESELNGEEYKYILDEKYRWCNWAINEELIGQELINFVNNDLFPYLSNISTRGRGEVISAIFSELANRVQSGYLLRDVLLKIDEIKFDSSNDIFELSHLYESLLQKMGDDGGNSGEFYTPRPVVRFAVEMVNPNIGQTVFDPAAGGGGFLAEANDVLSKKIKTSKDAKFLAEKTFYGKEKTPLAYLLGLMNLLLHGVEYPQLEKINTLSMDIRNIEEINKFDIIFANPPYGGKEQSIIQDNFPIKAAATELLFLQYIMAHLKYDGRAAVVVPEGVLFRTKGAFNKVKMALLKEFDLHSIVSLPAGVFLPYSNIKSSILFFDKTGPTKDVWFYEISLIDGKKLTKKNGINDLHFKEVRELFKNRSTTENSWLVPVEEIINRDTLLIAGRYNPNQKEEKSFLKPEEYKKEIKKSLEDSNKLVECISEMKFDFSKQDIISNEEKIKNVYIEKLELIKNKQLKNDKFLKYIEDMSDLPELPQGWIWTTLPFLVLNDNHAIKRGPFGSAIKKEFFVSEGYKVYEQQHAINNDFSLGNYYIDEDKFDELKSFELKGGDIIVSCSGTIGKVGIAPNDIKKGIINQALLKISLNQKLINNEYFKYLFESYIMDVDTLKDAQGCAIKNIPSVNELKVIPIPLPPLIQQEEIVKEVKEMLRIQQELEQLQNLINIYTKELTEVVQKSYVLGNIK